MKPREFIGSCIPLMLLVIGWSLTSCGSEAEVPPSDDVRVHWELNPYYTDQAYTYFKTPHNLRKMFPMQKMKQTPAEGSFDGGFFLIGGGVSGTYKGESVERYDIVRFAWNTGDDVYAIQDIRLENVRVRINDTLTVPTVSFVMDDDAISGYYGGIISGCMEHAWHQVPLTTQQTLARIQASDLKLLHDTADRAEFLRRNPELFKYVVISCRSKDWPVRVSLPLN